MFIPVMCALAFVALVLILGSFFTVNTAQVAIIARFGKFLSVANPGLNWKWPLIDQVVGRVSLRVNQITLTMETKTKDNVFVTIPISVQNRVRPEKVYDAFYKLSNPVEQIQSYVEQVILGHVPGMTLDEVFASQSGIAAAVKKELDVDMAGFGYEIVNVLVTDIVPDAKVKSAMNDINAAQREQVAAAARGESEKILVVKKAEAEAESKALQGQGIANERKAIIEGLQTSIEQFQKVVGTASTSEVMQLVLVTQYFDTLKSIGENDKTNTLFLSHSPGSVKDVSEQIMQSMLVAGRAPVTQSKTQAKAKDTPPGERIAKRLARAGVCSRREAERLILDGRVIVDGKAITSPALNVTAANKITVDGRVIAEPEEPRLWRYHKISGTITTTSDPQGRPTVFEKLPPELPRVVSVGRLDYNTEGLLLLTNDGELARHLELPVNAWLRHYRVRVHGAPKMRDIALLAKGVTISGIQYEPIKIEIENEKRTSTEEKGKANVWLSVTIREGKNREVRKAMEHIGLQVTRLIRVSFGPFQLGKLPRGGIEEVPRRILRESLGNFFKGDAK